MLAADLPILLVYPLLLFLSASFSGSETALFGLSYHDRMRLRRASPRAEALVARLLAHPRALLVTLLLLNTVVNSIYFVLSSALLIRHKESPGVALAINATTVVALIIIGELLPKVLGGANRVGACRLVAGPIWWVHRALGPIRSVIDRAIIAPFARVIHPEESAAEPLTVDELSALVELGGQEGAIDPGEQEILAEVLDLGEAKVREVMTPRVRMTWIDSQAVPARVSQVAASTRLTRIPVRRRGSAGMPATVLGFLNTKRYLAAAALPAPSTPPRLTDALEPVRYVPETARLDQLLAFFRTTRSAQALCVNEFGVVVGMIRVEDIAERLVTERSAGGAREGGAHDPSIQPIGRGRWRVPGRLSVRDWAELFGQDADPRVSTVAGLVQARLGRMAAPGDAVRIGNVRIEVESVIGKIVDRLIVSLVDDGDGHSPAAVSGAARVGVPS